MGDRLSYDGAFLDCPKMKELIIPEGVITQANRFPGGSNYIEHVQLPSTLKTIGNRGFVGCYNLK